MEVLTRCSDISITKRSAAGQIEEFTAKMLRYTNPCDTGSEKSYSLNCWMHCGIVDSLDVGDGDQMDEQAVKRALPQFE